MSMLIMQHDACHLEIAFSILRDLRFGGSIIVPSSSHAEERP